MKINLLPPAPPLVRVRVWAFTSSAAVLAALCAWLGVQGLGARAMWRAEQGTLAEQSLAIADLQKRLSAATAEQTRWAAVRAALAAQAQSPDPTRSFQALFTALPAKARVESLKCENGMLQATVRVDSLQAAARLVRRLQESADLADVVVSGVSAGGSAGGGTLVTFTARVPQTAAAGVVRSATSQIASGG